MDTIMWDRGQPPSLWGLWWNAILLLRPAFSRLRTFMWFATIVAGLTVRVELLGVTSIVRALNLRPTLYTKLLKNFHSSGLKLDRLSALWGQAVLLLSRIPHQAPVHHGAFPAGCRPARARGSERLLRTARRPYPRRPGMVQS